MLGLPAPYRTPGNTASQYGSFTARLEGRTVQSTVWKTTEKALLEGFPMYFLYVLRFY